MAIGTTSKYLSDFQVVKFTYMFNAFFDIEEVQYEKLYLFYTYCGQKFCAFHSVYNSWIWFYFQNGLIEKDDILAFGDRMCEYTGWKKDSAHYQRMRDILDTFHECVRDQVKAEYLSKQIHNFINFFVQKY